MTNEPEACVSCDSDAITQLARLGLAERYACAECWTVFEWPSGETVGEVADIWRSDKAKDQILLDRGESE